MKQILFFLGLAALLSGIFTSCKPDSLDAMREDEIVALDKYVKDKKLTDFKDVSGIYYKDSIVGTGDTIKTGYTVKMYFKITLLDGTVVFTTEDEFGHSFEEYTFYVDATDASIAQEYVQQIAGLHKGLKKMRIGGVANMVIPSEFAFKAVDNSSIGIPRFSTLLVKIIARKGIAPPKQ